MSVCFDFTSAKENRIELILDTLFELIQQICLKYYLNIVIHFIPFLLSKLRDYLDRTKSKLLSLKTATIKNSLTSKQLISAEALSFDVNALKSGLQILNLGVIKNIDFLNFALFGFI